MTVDRPTPDTVMAELRLREWLREHHDGPTGFMDDIRAVLAELDRQQGLNAASLAVVRGLVELQVPESDLPMSLSEWQTRWENAWDDARNVLLRERDEARARRDES